MAWRARGTLPERQVEVNNDKKTQESRFLAVQRAIVRYAFDDPKVTFFGVMPHPGPEGCTYLDVYSDSTPWSPLLDQRPPLLESTLLLHVCDSERATLWKPGKQPVSTPKEATRRNESLVHIELPFVDNGIFDALLKDAEKLLIPERITTAKVFGQPLSYRKPLLVRPIRLTGREIRVEAVQLIRHSDGTLESATLYKSGIPLAPLNLHCHANLLIELSDPISGNIAEDVRRQLVAHLPAQAAAEMPARIVNTQPATAEDFVPGEWEADER
jgi:hypothetical protein